jgi:hypothetical protein
VEWLETRPEAIQAREKAQIFSYFVQQLPYYCTWYMAVKISIDIGVTPESLYPDLLFLNKNSLQNIPLLRKEQL